MVIKRASAAIVLAVFLLGAETLHAQTTSAADQLSTKIEVLVRAINNARSEQEKVNAFDTNANIGLFALAVSLRKSPAAFVLAAEDARVDKQVGGSASNAGSTSLVSKGSIPSILGYAVENGALSRETSGTTITFRGNPVGIVKALGKSGFIQSYQNDDASTRFLRRISFALSFDTSRDPSGTSAEAGVFTGDRQQLASYSFRFDIFNKRDPRDPAYKKSWDTLIAGDVRAFTAPLQPIGDFLDDDAGFQAWHGQAQLAVLAASPANVEAVIRQELAKLETLPLPPDIEAAIDTYTKSYNSFLQNRDKLLEAVAKGPIVTFEYTNIRNVDAVDLSNFKLIAEGAFFHGRADLTANASLTILNRIPAGSNLDRVQDIDLSGQLDVPLGEVQKIGSIVLSFAGKYKHIMQDTMISNGMLADTNGDIGIGQVKLTIPVKGTGVRIPISLTFANRTDLIKENFVGGNIGITFDLDSIFARFKP
jgi:hypothetical protein